MLLVPTELRASTIHGLGVFAEEKILKGKVVWRMMPGLDVVVSKKDFKKLPRIVKGFIRYYGYDNDAEGGWIICGDNMRFFNHSERPNIIDRSPTVSIAARNISRGEELTCNYFDFDRSAKWKLLKGSVAFTKKQGVTFAM